MHPITALQTEYSLWSRDPEEEIIPTCRELGIALVPYSPLGRGFLMHQITNPDDLEDKDTRRKNPRFRPENLQHNLQLAKPLQNLPTKNTAPQPNWPWPGFWLKLRISSQSLAPRNQHTYRVTLKLLKYVLPEKTLNRLIKSRL